jgi:hypothetical protein
LVDTFHVSPPLFALLSCDENIGSISLSRVNRS